MVKLKKTKLLQDNPSSADEFGSHTKIAHLIKNEILGNDEGRSIALVGDWGSGKSTVIKLIDNEFRDKENPESTQKAEAHVFIYDAWSHQGDPLRRAFLDDFTAFLRERRLLQQDEGAAISNRIWSRIEEVETTTEPLLRRHTKILLIMFGFVPFGLALCGMTGLQNTWFVPLELIHFLGLTLLVIPMMWLGIFAIANKFSGEHRRYLFGIDPENKNFSVLSFFFEKIHGKIEKKNVKSPVDSIVAFKSVFAEILDRVQQNKTGSRVVIIIDNIDRIPADQARDFWSTMQTFFAADGGMRKPKTTRYWLIVPFSVQALSFIFKDDASSGSEGGSDEITMTPIAKAKAYINKTFSIAFFVPAPISSGWRKYLIGQLQVAFPEHDPKELIRVRDLFDFARSKTSLNITPRELKLFVNSLVVLYQQREDEISLAVLAAFILHRDELSKKGVAEVEPSIHEQRLLGTKDWRQQFAALQFGAVVAEGAQLLMLEPLLLALRKHNVEVLKNYESQPGFVDVLQRAVRIELDTPGVPDAANLAKMASMVNELDCASDDDLSGVWEDLKQQLSIAGDWDEFESPTASGVGAVLSRIVSEQERQSVCKQVAQSLSNAKVPNVESDYRTPNTAVHNWLETSAVVIQATDNSQLINIVVPGSLPFKVETLQQLSEVEIADTVKNAIKFVADEISKGIIAEIAKARYIRTPEKFVTFVVQQPDLKLGWQKITKAASERLSTAIAKEEVSVLLNLALSAYLIAGEENALATLKQLTVAGHLTNQLSAHQKNQEARAALLVAILLSNPAFERSGQVGDSSNGDNLFNQIVDNPPFDVNLISVVSSFVKLIGLEVRLYYAGAQNQKGQKFIASVLGALVKDGVRFNFEDPQFIIDERGFLEKFSNFNPPQQFIGQLTDTNAVLNALRSQPFEVARCRFYSTVKTFGTENNNEEFFKFLEDGIRGLSKEDWETALKAKSGAFLNLVELCSSLQDDGRKLAVEMNLRDAALEQIRRAEKDQAVITEEIRNRLDTVVKFLETGFCDNLIGDAIEDMAGATEVVVIIRIIEFFGNHITKNALDSFERKRIVQRIFNPLLGSPDENSSSWMANILANWPDFLKGIDKTTKAEFLSKLQAAVNNTSLTENTITQLNDLARSLNIQIPKPIKEDDKETKTAS